MWRKGTSFGQSLYAIGGKHRSHSNVWREMLSYQNVVFWFHGMDGRCAALILTSRLGCGFSCWPGNMAELDAMRLGVIGGARLAGELWVLYLGAIMGGTVMSSWTMA